ncbi:hypothetical protein DOY81_012116 [Sarcophaga bullata]|nr:hypothetical protein DOY81_012116 [Sarcophaga bullata]
MPQLQCSKFLCLHNIMNVRGLSQYSSEYRTVSNSRGNRSKHICEVRCLMKLEDLQNKLMTKQQERARLEGLVTEGSIFDDQKVAGLTVCNGAFHQHHHPRQL